MKIKYISALGLTLLITQMLTLPRLKAQDGEAYTVEYYYKVKWGYLDEFLDLYKKNHYPILKELKKRGEITAMEAEFPIYHGTEAGRWDFRYSITYKNFAASRNKALSDAISLQLFPDQASLKKEEQHRFELLIEHYDVPVREENPESWK
jgi:hypothetical protein